MPWIGVICLILGFLFGSLIAATEALIAKWWLWVASGIIIGVASMGVVLAGHDWLVPCASAFKGTGLQNADAQPGPAAAKPDSNSDVEKVVGDKLETYEKRADSRESSLKEKLESYDKRADNLERLLSLLIAFSTIYAAALALGAVRDANDSREKLEKIRKEATEEAAKIKESSPLVADIDKLVRKKMDDIPPLLATIDLSKQKYSDLADAQREQILFYERTMAASEYFDLSSLRPEASEIYHSLGNFYALKSKRVSPKSLSTATATTSGSPAPPGSALPLSPPLTAEDISKRLAEEDLARSRFYLQRSIELNPQNTVALNDFGYLELEIAEHPDDAKPYFARSLGSAPNQQRARYNLATIELTQLASSTNPTQALQRAVSWLTEALAMPTWQGNQLAGCYNADILYNRACSWARSGERASVPQHKHDFFERAMNDLEAAFTDPHRDHETLKKGLCRETGKLDPDLQALESDPNAQSDPKLQARLRKLRKEIC